MSLAVGARLGPCQILSSLGAGGMGEVYRARDTRLNREVALKLLPVAFAQDEDGRSGVFVQDFDPDKDTRASRRKLAGFDPVLLTESFAIAPDGSRIVLSEMEVTRKLLLVEGVAGVVRPGARPR